MLSFAATYFFSPLWAITVAVLGGEFFLKGVLGLRVRLRLPTFLVTATLAA